VTFTAEKRPFFVPACCLGQLESANHLHLFRHIPEVSLLYAQLAEVCGDSISNSGCLYQTRAIKR
jgi:hypothetical protein